jgi:hypothetical protein
MAASQGATAGASDLDLTLVLREPATADLLARLEAVRCTETQRLRLQREASRKLIRSTHVLRSEEASTWPHTLEEHVAMFVRGYPQRVTHIAFFLFEARNPGATMENFITRLRAFLDWMASPAGTA